jgi:hypothetical protein
MAYGNRGEYYNSELSMRWTDRKMDQKARAFSRYMNKKIRQRGGTLQDAGIGAYPNSVGEFVPKR